MSARIPKLIHYCWFGGGAKSALIERCMNSWAQCLPDWEFAEWTEENTPLDNVALCRDAASRGLWAIISDYARLLALYTHGGIYLDTDIEVRRDLDALRRHECVLGFQVERAQPDWVNNAVLGARPEHPFVADCLMRTLRYHERYGELPRSPAITTDALLSMGLRHYGFQELSGVTIYPTTYFYPYSWTETFSEACVTAETYTIHHWENSWRQSRPA